MEEFGTMMPAESCKLQSTNCNKILIDKSEKCWCFDLINLLSEPRPMCEIQTICDQYVGTCLGNMDTYFCKCHAGYENPAGDLKTCTGTLICILSCIG